MIERLATSPTPACKAAGFRALVIAWIATAGACAAWAAPVVVTPGTPAIHSFYPPVPPTGVSNGNDTIETLSLCRVSPTSGDRTLVMSSRNWYGYTKPINVYYKMAGGGAGVTLTAGGASFQQLASAGGSSAILKNGVMVAYASGQNVGGARNVSAGTFTVTSGDTIRFITGGGGGAGYVGQNYVGYFDLYGYPGGGGSGYYGGGSGQTYSNPGGGWPPFGAPVAYGGTGTAGGTGTGSGNLGTGGATAGAVGGTMGASGSSFTFALWNGYMVVNYTAGGGGSAGSPGHAGGESPGCPDVPPGSTRPASRPIANTFDLDPTSGTGGFGYAWFDGASTWPCVAGGAMGEIVLQYQAPSCDLVPHWNAP